MTTQSGLGLYFAHRVFAMNAFLAVCKGLLEFSELFPNLSCTVSLEAEIPAQAPA